MLNVVLIFTSFWLSLWWVYGAGYNRGARYILDLHRDRLLEIEAQWEAYENQRKVEAEQVNALVEKWTSERN